MRSNIFRASRPLYLARSSLASPYVLSGAYANTLTRLIPDLYAALNVVSRELVGFIPSAFRNVSAERAAVGQEVVYPIAPAGAMFDVTPAMTIPEPSDRVIGNGTLKITKSKGVDFGWTGEEQRGLNTGPGYLSIQSQNFAQALRTLTNAIELDLAIAALAGASRATGTAGTTPFATNVGDAAQVRKILDDNGAPATGRSLVVDTSAGAALRTLQNLTRVNEAGTSMTLRDGELLNLSGISIKESAQIQNAAASTAAGATTNAAGYAVGARVITLAAAGTGAVIAGSSIAFAGDANKYTVSALLGDADVSNGGPITINAPGLMKAIPAAATAITVTAAHVGNVGFVDTALHLIARAPALPAEGDMASDRRMLIDTRSGMSFEVSLYPGYRKIRAEVAAAWGVGVTQGEHIAELMG